MADKLICCVCKKSLSESPTLNINYACANGIPQYYRIFNYNDKSNGVRCVYSGMMIDYDEYFNEIIDEGLGIVHLICVADLKVSHPVILNPFNYNLAVTACGEHINKSFKPSDSWKTRLSSGMDERKLIYDKKRCWVCSPPTPILILPK